MRRLTLPLLSLLLTGLVAVGCGSSDSSSSTRTNATVPSERLGDTATKRIVTFIVENRSPGEARLIANQTLTTIRPYELKHVPVTFYGDDLAIPVLFIGSLGGTGTPTKKASFSVRVSCSDTCHATATVTQDEFGRSRAMVVPSDAMLVRLTIGT